MVVVFLSIDLLALVILRMLNTTLFSGADVAIGSNSGLFAIDACQIFLVDLPSTSHV